MSNETDSEDFSDILVDRPHDRHVSVYGELSREQMTLLASQRGMDMRQFSVLSEDEMQESLADWDCTATETGYLGTDAAPLNLE